MTISEKQFAALVELRSMPPGPARDAARLVLVQGCSVADAARAAGLQYRHAWRAVKRAESAFDLACKVAGR